MRHCSLLAMLLVLGSLPLGNYGAADDVATQPATPQSPAARISSPKEIVLPTHKPAWQAVEMVVDYGDGVQLRFTALPWHEKMTALDAVTAASAHPHGVKFVSRGAGSTAFVTQIGDVKNQGSGAESRNWLFSIGGKESEVGIGDASLQAGDVILWRFGVMDNNGN